MKSPRSWSIALATLALIAVTAVLLARIQGHQHLGEPGLRLSDLRLTNELGEIATTNSVLLPDSPLGCASQLRPIAREELNWLPRDTTYGRRYYRAADGFEALVSAVLMGSDRTSIHKPEYCLPGQGFQIQRRSPREIMIYDPHRYRLPVMRLDAVREYRTPEGQSVRLSAVYVYWFLSEDRLSRDHLQRMWWLALDLVRTGELQRWAYLGCLTVCPPGQEDAAYARLVSLIQAIVPQIHRNPGPALSLSAPPHPATLALLPVTPTGTAGESQR